MRFCWLDRLVIALAFAFFSILLAWWGVAWSKGGPPPPMLDLLRGTAIIFVPLWVFVRIMSAILFSYPRRNS